MGKKFNLALSRLSDFFDINLSFIGSFIYIYDD